jgi:hypothetical protein
MPHHKLFWLLMMLPCAVFAADIPDTFGNLLDKQAQVLENNLDAKIRASQPQIDTLAGLSSNSENNEPAVDAIWGMAGKEVVEMRFQGKRVAVSMQHPEISKSAGWKLEQVHPHQVVIVRVDGKKIVQRKTISMDWQSEISANASDDETLLPESATTLHITK